MIQPQQNYALSTETTRIEYEKIEKKLSEINIHFHRLKNQKGKIITINNNIQIEGNNNFWGDVDTLFSIGSFSYSSSKLGYGVCIGRYSSLASSIKIMGAHHFPDWISTSPVFYEKGFHTEDLSNISHIQRTKRRVNIGHDVWIGDNVLLKSDINIGNGAIIAANSVVTKDIPPYAIVGGCPAKIIKFRFDQQTIDLLTELQWWRFHKNDLKGASANNPELFITEIQKRIALGLISPFNPPIFHLDFFTK